MIINNPLKILLLQSDEQEVRDLVRMINQINPKNKVYSAFTLLEGSRIAQNTNLDILLLDLNLNDQQGYKTFLNCRKSIPHLPIVILASGGNEIIGEQAIRSGAQDYIVKAGLDVKLLSRTLHFAKHRHDIQLELQKKNHALVENERKLIQLQGISGMGTWDMDLLEQKIKGNEQFFHLMDFTANMKAISKAAFIDRVYQEDRPKVVEFFNDLDTSQESSNFDFRILISGNQLRHLRMSTRVQVDESAEKLVVIGIVQDISERSAIKALYSEKLYLSKVMELRDNMLNDIAFYIRTPLFSIVNFIYLLEDHPVRHQHRDAFNGLKASVDELQLYLNKLMNFSGIAKDGTPSTPKPFDLHYDLQMIKKILEYKNDEQAISCDVQIQPDIPKFVIGDASILYRILFNMQDLFKNLQSDKRRVSIQIITDTHNKEWFNLRIQCRDHFAYHQGFNPNSWLEKSHLSADYDALPESESMGRVNMLTLASLTKAASGNYQVNQLPGGSLRFLISLPYQLQSEEIIVAAQQDWIEPIRILLVEDHFLNQIATRNVVTSWSEYITVDIAENGLVAVEKTREYTYDLILMDIQMPVMNGIEASKKIRQRSDIPIIAMSAHASESESQRCKDVGINEYLSKPFKPEELKNKVFKMVSVLR
ncbi:MAG: response regulator [Saprospiraceae bacterium]|nr:response regulator [Saprospiraceae bacterium]